MATDRQQSWEGERFLVSHLVWLKYSHSPRYRKLNTPLCWYILGRVKFSLCTSLKRFQSWEPMAYWAQTALHIVCAVFVRRKKDFGHDPNWVSRRLSGVGGWSPQVDPWDRVTPIFQHIYTWTSSIGIERDVGVTANVNKLSGYIQKGFQMYVTSLSIFINCWQLR